MALPVHRSCVAENQTTALLLAIRTTQTHARYPNLLADLRRNSILAPVQRTQSGLITVAVEQRDLNEASFAALGAFRLQQYQLCRWYDLQRIAADQVECDPQLNTLPASTIHIFSGTPEGHLLAYACLQGANALTPGEAALLNQQQTLFLTDAPRPLFASERELFGSACFSTLPALCRVPLAELAELNCFLRNQALPSPLSTIAAIEALLLMTRCILRPDAVLQDILGASDRESRRLLKALGYPMLYAPHAPVVVPFLPYQHYWATGEVGTSAQGKYWPFVVSSVDLRNQQAHFDQLETLLGQSPSAIRRGLVHLRRQAQPGNPAALAPASTTLAAHIWKMFPTA